MKKERLGEVYWTTEGYKITIVVYTNAHNCVVEFENGYRVKAEFKTIKNGKIKNPYHPSVWNVGFLGEGKHRPTILGRHTKMNNTWSNMLMRCYDLKYQETYPSYKECTSDSTWYNFQNFGDWFEENFNPEYMKNWALDKDILVKGNKIYSAETCCFVPQEINSLLIGNKDERGDLPIGVRRHRNKFIASLSKNNIRVYLGTFDTPEEAFEVYKIAKEEWIKVLANKWRGLISEMVYWALMNWVIKMTD